MVYYHNVYFSELITSSKCRIFYQALWFLSYLNTLWFTKSFVLTFDVFYHVYATSCDMYILNVLNNFKAVVLFL